MQTAVTQRCGKMELSTKCRRDDVGKMELSTNLPHDTRYSAFSAEIYGQKGGRLSLKTWTQAELYNIFMAG